MLGLIGQGAGGNTLTELKKTLQIHGSKYTMANNFSKLIKNLIQGQGEPNLNLANRIYINDQYKINSKFQKVAKLKFKSSAKSIDFSDNVNAANKINYWVADHTNDKILNLISSNLLTKETRMVLVNAIYFKGKWLNPFHKNNTAKGKFFTNFKDSVSLDFMQQTKQFNYGTIKNLDADVLEMKYANSKISFIAILSKTRTGLSKIKENLAKSKKLTLSKIRKCMAMKHVNVIIPKFTISFKIELNNGLQKVFMLFKIPVS